MSIDLMATVVGPGVAVPVGVEADVELCAGAGDGVGVAGEVGPGCEQDGRTRATPRLMAVIRIRWSGVAFVTIGSLGRWV